MIRLRAVPRISPTRLLNQWSQPKRQFPPLLQTSLQRQRQSTSQSRAFHASRILGGNFPFKLHDIGEGIAEVEVVKWYVEVGQKVEEFDVLCEVQSDKSTVELTSPTIGVVKRLGAKEGVILKVGEVVCDIETDSGEAEEHEELSKDPEVEVGKSTATASPAPSSAPAPTPVAVEEVPSQEDESLHRSRDDILDIPQGAQFSGEAAMLPSPPPRSLPSHPPSDPGTTEKRRESQPWSELRKIVKASPAVRTLAARLGVHLGDVRGSGEGGRVLRDDITLYSSGGSVNRGLDEGGLSLGEQGEGERDQVPIVTRVEFGRTRKVMYRAMGDMGQVPHFGYTHTLNLTPLLPYLKSRDTKQKKIYQASDIPSSLSRDPLSGEDLLEKAGLLSYLVKGLLLALEVHPIMRSRVRFGGDNEKWLEVSRDGTIGVAVSDPKYGLLTPSLPPLSPSTPLSTITQHLTNIRKNATKPSSPANLTISSVGGLGEARGAMPVLPPGGGVAICAVGRAGWFLEPRLGGGKRVWDCTPQEVVEGGMEGVLRCSVGWSGDHRVLEGAELIAFTETWKMYIEEPWRWMKID